MTKTMKCTVTLKSEKLDVSSKDALSASFSTLLPSIVDAIMKAAAGAGERDLDLDIDIDTMAGHFSGGIHIG